jgi:hypothetical protein
MGGNPQLDLQSDNYKKALQETPSDTGRIRSEWISFTYD